MKSAPCLRLVRTALRTSSGPSARFCTIGDVDVDRELPRVAGAAGRRHVVARRQQPRARHDALVDRLPQVDVGVRPGRPHVAAGREPGHQRDERVVRAVQRRLPRRRLQQLVFPVHASARQMRVEIDQARQQRGAAEIDDARAVGIVTLLPAAAMRSPRIDDDRRRRSRRRVRQRSSGPRELPSRGAARLSADHRDRRGDREKLLHSGVYNTWLCRSAPRFTSARSRSLEA